MESYRRRSSLIPHPHHFHPDDSIEEQIVSGDNNTVENCEADFDTIDQKFNGLVMINEDDQNVPTIHSEPAFGINNDSSKSLAYNESSQPIKPAFDNTGKPNTIGSLLRSIDANKANVTAVNAVLPANQEQGSNPEQRCDRLYSITSFTLDDIPIIPIISKRTRLRRSLRMIGTTACISIGLTVLIVGILIYFLPMVKIGEVTERDQNSKTTRDLNRLIGECLVVFSCLLIIMGSMVAFSLFSKIRHLFKSVKR